MKQHVESLEGRRLLSSVGTVQTIDSLGSVGEYTSIALQPANHLPAIAYYDVTNHELKYAYEDGGGWHTQRVDGGNSDDVGQYASMAFDSSGTAWIAYYDVTNQDLKIAHGNGITAWTIKTVDSTGTQGLYASLALTKAGLPRISYQGNVGSNGGGGLKFASFDGSHWTITNVDVDTTADSFNSDNDGQYTSLALDGKDRPRISYAKETNGTGHFELDYASFDGHQFNVETVDSAALNDVGFDSHLLLDSAGNPHISSVSPFEMGGGGDVEEATKSTGTWKFTTIDSPVGGEVSGLDDDETSFVMDSAGNSYVAFQANDALALSVRNSGSSTYSSKEIDEVGQTGKYASIALDSATNTLQIAYYDALAGDLKLYTGSVDAPGVIPKDFEATYNDMKVAPDGTLNLAYYDNFEGENDELHFATRSPGGVWTDDQTIDSTAGNGAYVSMALDSTGSPVVAYYDSKNADLKYAYLSKGKWKIQVVDSKKAVGLYTSIAFDAAGDPAISYYAKTIGDLRLATLINGKWSIQTVDSTGDVGRFSQLALDPTTKRFDIAYERTSTGATCFAENQADGSWKITTIDTTPSGGGYISLAFAKTGEPAISYYDGFNADLKFAQRSASGWQTTTVASKKAQGLYTKLYFTGKKSVAHILYFNKSANEMDIAVGNLGSKWSISDLRADGGRNISFAENNAGDQFIAYGPGFDITVEQLL